MASRTTNSKASSRADKRPKRGYQRIRKTGDLNIAPKTTEEKKMVLENSEIPLLSLPPELRNMIWELVVGGNVLYLANSSSTYRPFRAKVMIFDKAEPQKKLGLELLSTCRQIYNETKDMPYKYNGFSTMFVTPWTCLTRLRKVLPRHGIEQIATLELCLLRRRDLAMCLGTAVGKKGLLNVFTTLTNLNVEVNLRLALTLDDMEDIRNGVEELLGGNVGNSRCQIKYTVIPRKSLVQG